MSNYNVLQRKVLPFLGNYKALLFTLLLFVVMLFVSPNFAAPSNIVAILSNVSLEGLIAIGATFVIIIREIDLSVGANMAFTCVFAIMLQEYGMLPAIVIPILIGLVIGFINGFFVTRFRLPSMGVTLAMQVILDGMALAITSRQTIRGVLPEFRGIALKTVFGAPMMVWIFIIVSLLFELVLMRTAFGRNCFACGGNLTASKYSGIDVDKTRIFAFMLTGLLGGCAGVLCAAKYNAAGAIIGTNTAFYIITAVMLGGTSLAGGEGSVLKTFQGMLFIGALESFLNFNGWTTGYRDSVVGIILLIMLLFVSIINLRKKYE